MAGGAPSTPMGDCSLEVPASASSSAREPSARTLPASSAASAILERAGGAPPVPSALELQAVHNDTTRATVEQAWEGTDASGGPQTPCSHQKQPPRVWAMLLAHIFGIPVEETALTFAPAIVAFIVGARAYTHQVARKLHSPARP